MINNAIFGQIYTSNRNDIIFEVVTSKKIALRRIVTPYFNMEIYYDVT